MAQPLPTASMRLLTVSTQMTPGSEDWMKMSLMFTVSGWNDICRGTVSPIMT